MTAFPVDRHGLIRRPTALAFDISDDELCAAVRRGALLRLTRACMCRNSKAFDDAKGREELFRLQSIAVATSCADHALPLSHTSAAAVHRLLTLSPDHPSRARDHDRWAWRRDPFEPPRPPVDPARRRGS